jgi:hypothetical protein
VEAGSREENASKQRALALLFTKSLCIAAKRFDSAACHAIDHRQPH